MICPYCGKVNTDSNTICLYCGMRTTSVRSSDGIIPRRADDAHEGVFSVEDAAGSDWVKLRTSSVRHRRSGSVHVSEPVFSYKTTLGISGYPSSILQRSLLGDDDIDSDVTLYTLPETLEDDALETIPPSPVKQDVPARSYAAEWSEETYLTDTLGDRYTIEKKLGSGGMATVWLAHERALGRQVAIKLLSRNFSHDTMFVERFRREAKIAASLEHPNIVRIYTIGEEDGPCYFIMGYIPGGSIAAYLAEGKPIAAESLLQWAIDIGDALVYSHARGVVHRDLKPDNIMIDSNGHAVLTDFGIAHAAAGTVLTQAGQVLGTPQYMSPEQALGKPADARSDIYSFGIVLYHMATGRLPFKADDAVSLMYMHVHSAPVAPKSHNPSLPQWLNDLIMKCIEKKPEVRFGSADEIVREFLNHSYT